MRCGEKMSLLFKRGMTHFGTQLCMGRRLLQAGGGRRRGERERERDVGTTIQTVHSVLERGGGGASG